MLRGFTLGVGPETRVLALRASNKTTLYAVERPLGLKPAARFVSRS